ncbi:MAG: Crp/Fnr family transcriptional regulator [Bacteroidia bacterium]
MEKHLLLEELQAKYAFPDEDFPKLIELFGHCTYRKNAMLFSAGELVKHTWFILKGCVRQYYIGPEGRERIIYFAREGNWCGELNSFLHEEPTKLSMQALEDVEAIYLTRTNWEKAITTIPAFAMYHITNHQRLMVKLKEELGMAVNESPDEKYRRLVQENPELLQRLPQYQIAMYLGITPETLSRIRKRNAKI